MQATCELQCATWNSATRHRLTIPETETIIAIRTETSRSLVIPRSEALPAFAKAVRHRTFKMF